MFDINVQLCFAICEPKKAFENALKCDVSVQCMLKAKAG
jgi:hypothetical protein